LRPTKDARMPNTLGLFVVVLFMLSCSSVVSAVTVTNIKNSTSTNFHCCHLFTACRQIKASFSGGPLNPYFCAYSHNGNQTTKPPPPPLGNTERMGLFQEKKILDPKFEISGNKIPTQSTRPSILWENEPNFRGFGFALHSTGSGGNKSG